MYDSGVTVRYKVGDEVIFTELCPNTHFRGVIGTIVDIKSTVIKIILGRHPASPSHYEWIETIYQQDYKLIRKLTKLDKALQ